MKRIIYFAIIGYSFLSTNLSIAGFSHLLDVSIETEENIKSAIVRVELYSLDVNKMPIQRDSFGHGVLISPNGIVLTAAHNIFPLKNWNNRALFYKIRILNWNPKAEEFSELKNIYSEDVERSVIYSKNLPLLDWQPNPNFAAMPVLNQMPSRKIDFAFIFTKSKTKFIDVTGPLDQIDPKRGFTSFWTKVVLSDFFSKNSIRDVRVQQPQNNNFYIFQTDSNKKFHKGISGSPLIVQTINRRIYVAGIVTDVVKGGDKFGNGNDLDMCYVNFIYDLFSDETCDHRQILEEKEEFFNCKEFTGFPDPEPLINNYARLLKKINSPSLFQRIFNLSPISDNEYKIFMDCLAENSTWESTRSVIAFQHDARALLNSVNSFLAEKKERYDAKYITANTDTDIDAVLNESPLTVEEDKKIAELLVKAKKTQRFTDTPMVFESIPKVISPGESNWGFDQITKLVTDAQKGKIPNKKFLINSPETMSALKTYEEEIY